eukprot:jgi/Astpho2/3642/fgenesh1_pg.00059_%23_4_t
MGGLAHFTWHRQLLAVSGLVGRGLLAKITTCLLILGEASLPIYLMAQHSLRVLQRSIFQDVMQDQGVLPVRQVTPTEKQQINAFLNAQAARIEEERRKRRQSAGSLASYIIRKGAIHLVSSPLTSVVPFAPLLFSVRGGHNLAAPFMAPYFLMKGLPSPDEQAAVIDSNKMRYRQFGMTVALLQTLPVISWGFALSNSVGAALWAADMERRQTPLLTSNMFTAPPSPAPEAGRPAQPSN